MLYGLVVRMQLQGFAAERKGEREEMQDAHVIIDDFSSYVGCDSQSVIVYTGVSHEVENLHITTKTLVPYFDVTISSRDLHHKKLLDS